MGNRNLEELLEGLPAVLLNHDASRFNEWEYEESLKEYTERYLPLFKELAFGCGGETMDLEMVNERIGRACTAILDAVDKDLKDPKKYRGWNRRGLQLDTYKTVVVTYLAPAVFKMDLPISKTFNQTFHDLWLKRYPGQDYQAVTEQQITLGFEKKWFSDFVNVLKGKKK